jgi:hypothetical protein
MKSIEKNRDFYLKNYEKGWKSDIITDIIKPGG